MAAASIGERDAAIPMFLRGLDDNPDPPETQVVWRRDVSLLCKAARTPDAGEGLVEAALDAFPPIAREVLKAPTGFVGRELRKLAGRVGPMACIVRDPTGAIRFHTLEADTEPEGLAYGTVFLPAEAGGLTGQGLLDGSAAACVEDLGDDEDRVRFDESAGVSSDGSEVPDWVGGAACLRIPLGSDSNLPAGSVWQAVLGYAPGTPPHVHMLHVHLLHRTSLSHRNRRSCADRRFGR